MTVVGSHIALETPYTLTDREVEIIEQAIENPTQSIRDLVKDDLATFIEIFWETYQDKKYVGNWHIEKICKELEDIARNVAAENPKDHDLLINVPPGTTKTATVSIFWPVWCWVNWPGMRFITSSHSADLSLESAEYSRDIIRSDLFQSIFPDIRIKQDKEKKSNFRIQYKVGSRWKRGGSRVSTSVGSKITGFHADIIIADDLIDPKGAISKTKVDDANFHMDQTLSTRKTDKAVTCTVMIAQRLGVVDPSGHWLAKGKKDLKHICLPGEISNYKEFLKPLEWEKYYIDSLLDPKRMSWAVLDDLRAELGQYGYHGQVGQNPILAGAGMFDTDKIEIVERLPSISRLQDCVRYWDKAGTDRTKAKLESPHTAGVKMYLLSDGRYLITHVRRGQWASHERERIIKNVAAADDLERENGGLQVRIWVEQEPGSGGKESAESTTRNLAGYHIRTERPVGDKIYRADPFSVQVNEGNVLLLRGDWNEAYLDELKNFPMGNLKDQTDASSGAFSKLTGKKRVKIHDR